MEANRDIDYKKAEQEAIIKYEKSAKPYRPIYRDTGSTIKCEKCGSTRSLTKTVVGNETYWFCKDCIMQRARELKNNRK